MVEDLEAAATAATPTEAAVAGPGARVAARSGGAWAELPSATKSFCMPVRDGYFFRGVFRSQHLRCDLSRTFDGGLDEPAADEAAGSDSGSDGDGGGGDGGE